MSYVLCDGKPTFIYSHLVKTTKFNMVVAWHKQRGGKGGSQFYTLPTKAFNHIQAMQVQHNFKLFSQYHFFLTLESYGLPL